MDSGRNVTGPVDGVQLMEVQVDVTGGQVSMVS